MEQIENLKDLFVEQGRELYDASLQEQKELPNIEKRAKTQELKKIINRQIKTAKDQNERLQQAFKELKAVPTGVKSLYCDAIMRQTRDLIDRCKDPEVCDAAIVGAIQHLNHHKITGYGTLAAYANELGQRDLATKLHQALEEEKTIDTELNNLAKREINKTAVTAVAH